MAIPTAAVSLRACAPARLRACATARLRACSLLCAFALRATDLVPNENAVAWLKVLRNELPTVAFKANTQKQGTNLGRSSSKDATKAASHLAGKAECLGASTLLQLLKNYCRNLNLKTAISVGVIGFPNVGKSSLINSLKRSRVVGVGSTPGFTKTVQEVHLDKHVKLLDSPGIVFTTKTDGVDASTALRNCVKIDKLDDPVSPVDLIVKRCEQESLMMLYRIAAFEEGNTTAFLTKIATKQGPSRAKSASRSVRRALLMSQANPRSLYRCGKRT